LEKLGGHFSALSKSQLYKNVEEGLKVAHDTQQPIDISFDFHPISSFSYQASSSAPLPTHFRQGQKPSQRRKGNQNELNMVQFDWKMLKY
jgi:hypothetical protein